MEETSSPVLLEHLFRREAGRIVSWLIGLPLAGAIAILFLPRQTPGILRWTTLLVMGGTLAASLLLLDAPIQMTQYQPQTGYIEMTNTGTATWKAGVVKLAPIPRDTPSDFQAPSWLSPTRVSTLAAAPLKLLHRLAEPLGG